MFSRFSSFRTVVSLVVILAIAAITVAANWGGSFAGLNFFAPSAAAETVNKAPEPIVIGPGPTCTTAGLIEAQSTGGTAAGTPTAYATLKDSFDAINLGVIHTGAITIEVCGNTTETASAVLNSGAVSPAAYTSVNIFPLGGARTITGSIVGAVIKLNGADNVTIDGRIGGTGRNLTVSNSSTAAATAAVWLASVAAGNGASNNVIRNLEIAAGTDSSSSSTSASFGIIMSGTTVSATSNGVDNDNNSFVANRVIKARYGIVTRGTTTDLNINPVVTDNIVGPAAFGTDQIGKVGIFMQADTGANVSRNTVQNVGCLEPQACTGADRMGIAIGNESWSMSPGTITSNNYRVTRNIVHDVIEELTFTAMGINLATTGGGSPTNNLVANNFIYNVRANGTAGDQAVGLGIAGGHTDSVVFNSIAMTGDVDPGVSAASSNFGSGIRIANANGTTHTNLTLKNNSVYMDLSSSSAPTIRYYAISGNTAAYVFGTGGENQNNYYINPANVQLQTGGLGTVSGVTLTTQFATLANWQAAYTVPQDAASIQADPLYVSPTADLHIAIGSPNVNAGATGTGVIVDIDNQLRDATPDIGADEPNGTALPANDIAATTILTPANGSLLPTGATPSPQASFTNVGAAAQTNVMVQFTITGPGGYNYSNTQSIASIEPEQTVVVTFAAVPAFTTVGAYVSGAAVTTPDANAANDSVAGGFTVVSPLSGTYTVGSGGNFTSLTNPGGVFETINAAGATGNIVIDITSDLTGENGGIALNEIAGGFTVLIKPSGVPRSITGSSTVGIIRLNSADGVTVNGSTTGAVVESNVVGGNPALRELTVNNTNAAATGGAVIVVMAGANGAQNNTFKNINIAGFSPTATLIGIALGGASPGTAGLDNDNNRVENCSIQRAFIGIYNVGASAANPNTGTVITQNDLSATGANRLRRAGMLVFNENGIQITENSIGGITSDEGLDAYGIGVGIQDVTATAATSGGVSNALISRNKISGIVSTSAVGFSASGIAIGGDPAGPNTISNNMISGVSAPSTSPDITQGIFVAGVVSSNTRLYHNSISLTGDRGAVASQIGSYGVAISGTNPIVELKNNIFYTTQTSGGGANADSYAIGMASATFTNLNSNFNDFFFSGANAVGFRTGSLGATGTDFTTLVGWQGATGQDAGSFNVDPTYVDPLSNLHLQAGSPMINVGTTGTGVTVDFDGQTRDATPDIGADEFVVVEADLGVTKTDSPDPVAPGGNITYTINFINNGPDAAQTVTVTDVMPAGTTFVAANPPPGWSTVTPPVGGNGTIEFSNGTVAAAGTAQFTIVVQVAPATPNGTVISNTATTASATGDSTSGNNSSTATTTVQAPAGALQLSSTAYSGSEGGNATAMVDRVGGTNGVVGATYSFTDGTATGGAVCGVGVDYVNTGGTVSFADGSATSQPINIPLCTDAVTDVAEAFTVTISAPTGGATLGSPTSATVTITDVTVGGPVTVTATAGTTGPTNYNTVKEAFDAINAGTHQGAINVAINSNTTETASAILNASGGTSSYTSVLIRPTATATVTGSFAGAVIKLNGADNVTIDGRIGGTGTSRDLTVSNGSTATATAAIWLSSLGAGAGATNNTVRNLELSCGVNTSTSALLTFGIIMNGATVSAASNGEDNDNNAFVANRIIRARYGIVTRGLITNRNLNPVVTDNIIGPSAFGPDQIGKVGIFMQADTGATISRNTVQFVGGEFATTTAGADRVGIALGSESWASTPTTLAGDGYTVTRNVIHDVNEERTFSALGILSSTTNGTSPTSNVIANNFIYNVKANGTAGDAAVGIGIGSGNGDSVVFNSVRMAGDMDPNASAALPTQIPVNLRIAAAPTNLTVKNNSLYNDLFSSSAPALNTVNIQVASATYSFGTGGLNNNNYFFPATNTVARTGAIGATSLPTTFFATLANWQGALTPAQDAASIQADPQYLSATDLHIALASPNVNAGATGTGILNDIDAQLRDATPDIGADEPNGVTPPANDIAATAIVTPANGSTLINGTSTTPQARFTNVGSATQTSVGVQYTITGPGGYNYSNSQSIASIAPDESVVVTFTAAPAFTTAGLYTTTATVTTPDSNAGNDSVGGTFNVINPLAGTYTVGAGGNFTSLTNPGGLFDLLNSAGASGNVTADITSDLTGETGAIVLNQLPGGFGLTIKPSGAARTISGTAASLSMIKLNGADNITIDGSLSGGTDRSLTILYTNTGGTVIWIAAAGAGNGANNNTIKNCNVASNPGTVTIAAILGGSGVTLGGAAEAPNNNNTIQNNWLFRVQNSIYNQGNIGFDQNWNISGNTFGSTVPADKNSFRGMLMGNAQNFTINGNTVNGISSTATTTAAMTGIQLAFTLNGGFIVNNTIRDIRNNSGTGTGAFGMQISSATAAANVTIANNMVSDIAALGSATLVNNGHGININGAGAGGYKIYHNSINMNANQGSGTTSAMHVIGTVTAAGALDVRNNIFANTQTAGATRYAVFSAAANTVYTPINYNNYFSTQNVGNIGGTPRVTLADWQTGTGQDANSTAVDPLFISPTDLHLSPGSPMIDTAFTLAAVPTDFDGQTRPIGAANDIGADEWIGTVTIRGRVLTAGGQGIKNITVRITGGNLPPEGISAQTGPFGYYVFPPLPTGFTYTILIKGKRYTFTPDIFTFTLYADMEFNFTSNETDMTFNP